MNHSQALRRGKRSLTAFTGDALVEVEDVRVTHVLNVDSRVLCLKMTYSCRTQSVPRTKSSYMGEVRSLATNAMGRTYAIINSVGAVTYFPAGDVRRESTVIDSIHAVHFSN